MCFAVVNEAVLNVNEPNMHVSEQIINTNYSTLLSRAAWVQAGLSIRFRQSVSQSVSQSVC